MASKFAGLPGIAHGEPDFYETTGTAVSAPDVIYDNSVNENIDRLKLNAGQSYANFKGKTLLADGVDFSDSVAKLKISGYKSSPDDIFTADGDGMPDESLQERCERIQADIRALEADYRSLAADQQRQESFLPQQATDFSDKIDQVKSQLATVSAMVNSPKSTVRQPSAGVGPDGNGVDADEYEQNQTNVIITERRIRRLEQAFGTDKDLDVLSADSSNSLTATVTMLKNQMSLLDKDNLDHIEMRIQSFLPKLNQALDKKPHASDSELERKVTEAYALLKRWESTMDTMTSVVDRLVALKTVHRQATTYVLLQQEVEGLVQQLTAKMAIMEGNIKLSEESFAQNMTTIKKSVEHLEARLKAAK